MTATLSTHVLDTTHGIPAQGLAIRLLQGAETLFSGVTNADGRCPGIDPVTQGIYRLEFSVADYFRAKRITLPEPPFLDVVGIDFGIADGGGHYHVPLLVSPFGYSTYRGS